MSALKNEDVGLVCVRVCVPRILVLVLGTAHHPLVRRACLVPCSSHDTARPNQGLAWAPLDLQSTLYLYLDSSLEGTTPPPSPAARCPSVSAGSCGPILWVASGAREGRLVGEEVRVGVATLLLFV